MQSILRAVTVNPTGTGGPWRDRAMVVSRQYAYGAADARIGPGRCWSSPHDGGTRPSLTPQAVRFGYYELCKKASDTIALVFLFLS